MEALSKAEKQGEAATAKDAQIKTLTQQLQEAKKDDVSSSSGWLKLYSLHVVSINVVVIVHFNVGVCTGCKDNVKIIVNG